MAQKREPRPHAQRPERQFILFLPAFPAGADEIAHPTRTDGQNHFEDRGEARMGTHPFSAIAHRESMTQKREPRPRARRPERQFILFLPAFPAGADEIAQTAKNTSRIEARLEWARTLFPANAHCENMAQKREPRPHAQRPELPFVLFLPAFSATLPRIRAVPAGTLPAGADEIAQPPREDGQRGQRHGDGQNHADHVRTP